MYYLFPIILVDVDNKDYFTYFVVISVSQTKLKIKIEIGEVTVQSCQYKIY